MTLLLALHCLWVLGQDQKIIQILDADTEQPIVGVSYRYQDQKGISDDQGKIRLQTEADSWLYLSHLSYGRWQLDPKELAGVFAQGKIYQAEIQHSLQAVSVISLKHAGEKDRQITLSETDRLNQDAGAVLALDPAISGIRKSGNFAFDPVLRGFKYDRLNLVVNGMQTANAACPSRMDPPSSQVNLNRISRVEILKGPHALRYGIGLGGTINYVQQAPAFSSQSGAYGNFSAQYNGNGELWRNEGSVGFRGKNYDFGIQANYAQGAVYKDGNGNEVRAGFKRGSVGIYGDVQVSDRDLVQVTLNRNVARDVEYASLGMDLRTDDTWMASLKHSRSYQGSSLQTWTNSAYFTQVDHLMDNGLRDPGMMIHSAPATTRNWGYRSEGQWGFRNGKLYAGLDIRQETADGKGIREMGGMVTESTMWQDSHISKLGLFASYSVALGSNVLTTAARLDYNQAEAKDPAEQFAQLYDDLESSQLNPGISVGLQRDLGKTFNLGIWAARVTRSGSILERFSNYSMIGLDPYQVVGNPQIKPETNHELDVVLGFQKEKVQAEVTVFGSYLTDYITAVKTDLPPTMMSSPGVRQIVNVDEVFKAGGEFAISHQLSPHFSHRVQLAYTYGQDLGLDEPLAEIAPLDVRYQAMGRFLEDKLQVNLSLRGVSAQDQVSAEFGENVTLGFTLVDLDASYPISDFMVIKGGVQNLFNEAYYEHLSRPLNVDKTPMYSPGRNLFLMLSFKFP